MQDVAVKVLTVQDFQDDQLKEFLREVCKSALGQCIVIIFGCWENFPFLLCVKY